MTFLTWIKSNIIGDLYTCLSFLIAVVRVHYVVVLMLAHFLYLTIIPQAWMGSESIAREAEGRMGYWLVGHEGNRNNIVLVKSN